MAVKERVGRGLERARAVFEELMKFGTVEVVTRSEPVFDPDTGLNTVTETTVYTGTAHWRLGQARPVKTVEVGESINTLREWRFRFPSTAPTLPIGAIIEVLTAERAPQMIGQRFRIDDYPEGALAITPTYIATQYHERTHDVP